MYGFGLGRLQVCGEIGRVAVRYSQDGAMLCGMWDASGFEGGGGWKKEKGRKGRREEAKKRKGGCGSSVKVRTK
jgi:hypothetical protein